MDATPSRSGNRRSSSADSQSGWISTRGPSREGAYLHLSRRVARRRSAVPPRQAPPVHISILPTENRPPTEQPASEGSPPQRKQTFEGWWNRLHADMVWEYEFKQWWNGMHASMQPSPPHGATPRPEEEPMSPGSTEVEPTPGDSPTSCTPLPVEEEGSVGVPPIRMPPVCAPTPPNDHSWRPSTADWDAYQSLLKREEEEEKD